MIKKIQTSILLSVFLSFCLNAQKIPLDRNSYDGWKSLTSPIASDDGTWISYVINPQQGDGWLYLYNVLTGRKDSTARGFNLHFSPGCSYAVFQVLPSYAQTRQAKKKKLKEDKMPKNDLEIKLLSKNQIFNIPGVKSFGTAEKNSGWMAYLLEKKDSGKNDKMNTDDSVKTHQTAHSGKAKAPEAKGTDFIIFNPERDKKYEYSDVTEFAVAKDGMSISFLQDVPDTTKIDNFIVNVFDTGDESSKLIFEGKGSAKKLTSDKTGSLVSFIYSPDTSKAKVYDLWLSEKRSGAQKIVKAGDSSLPHRWSVSEHGNISFSDDGRRIYFGTAVKPVKETEDTLLDDEKYRLDIWSWNDDILQPMQKKQLDLEKKRSYLAVFDVDKSTIHQLADSTIPTVKVYQKGNNDIAMGTSDLRYRRSASWDGGGTQDVYIVNVKTGIKSLELEKCNSNVYLSPACKFLLYWDTAEKSWISVSFKNGEHKNLTSDIKVPLCDELNDLPDDPQPHGIAGWSKDEKHVFIYDRYDIWSVDLNGSDSPVNITNGFGRRNNIRLRYVRLDPEEEFINTGKPSYLSAFNYENKSAGFFRIRLDKQIDPATLIMDKVSFPGQPVKAKNADLLLWQRGTFADYPELYVSDMNFANDKKISTTNPQQKKYNWGTCELVEWMSYDHTKLQGILYKPEDFDPTKKYPMIVYFYERSSDGLYTYMPPAPSASIINRIFAVSNGYLVFVPDIIYTTGYPGQSCYNAVVSGTSALLDRFGFIDKNRLGLDGQSWGGYQISYLVTQTDLFACAYAGAPVSDMISAYGGIRWGTGMSRMFQYEKTQSRIGGTLWDKPLHFLENSPIFWVPKINTPLLLMHNDADDAVPWYQSIEFITALRRLNKPAWLLSYNDESHNLMRRADRKDISIRKMEFFDYYLKNAPMPYWMQHGITQLQKGHIDGYNLLSE